MRRLYRDRWDKKVAGVCGGLGQFLKIDPTVIRLALVMLCVLTGVLPFLVIYLIAWMLIPQGPATYIELKCRKLHRSSKDRKIGGVCGGIAEILKIDPTIIRLVFIFAMILTGFFPLIIAYIVGVLIIPENPQN
ncbi:MAG: PspC domain-containing protein [Chlamydiia bacterium]|nr:PspC domain-containing protein [Chlamydiia bacterium]